SRVFQYMVLRSGTPRCRGCARCRACANSSLEPRGGTPGPQLPGDSVMLTLRRHVAWLIVAVLGAFALATVALSRGEAVSALWIVVAAVCVYLIAYRYYSLFLAQRVLGLDANRQTPAWAHNDGLDYVPTNKVVLYGHHFAAIAGAGPLVGPVLAAQMG